MGIHIGHLINREKIDIAMLIKISRSESSIIRYKSIAKLKYLYYICCVE